MVNEQAEKAFYADIGDDEEFRKRYGERIGVGMSAVIYAHDGIAAKVYREGQPGYIGFREAFTQVLVEGYGIPAPKVYRVETFCGRTAVIMDQVIGKSLLDIFLENQEKGGECLDIAVELQTAMHKVLSGEFLPLKTVLNGMIISSPGLNSGEKERLLTMLPALPEGSSICHGDFHCGNIIYDGNSCKIIDWVEVSSGSPAGDACRSYLDYSMLPQGMADMYLDKYCAASGITRQEILAWLPVVAGALYGFLTDEAKKTIRKFF